MDDVTSVKRDLRERLRFRRRHFVAGLDELRRFAAFRAPPSPLLELLEQHRPVGAYVALGGEPDIIPMLNIISDNSLFALPRHQLRDEHMDFHLWQRDDALEKGPWGIMQPVAAAPTASPAILLCPLLGFDRQGGRIGQGAGHYDRYFARHEKALRIGIAWSVQEVDRVPQEPADVSLDAILTEQEWIVCGDRL